ncbi:cold shock protein (beta-ribbon, CspA family) [Stappia sp. ES.058]|nr:cold-shock protein [Stappia sp. ES.058]SDU28708.1 cold shock protein (beta-ribbon, CspA family) [Stappia sp. ES.058]
MNDWRSDNRRQGKRRGGSKEYSDGDEFGGAPDHGKRNKPSRGGRRDSFSEAGWASPEVPENAFPPGERFAGGDRPGGDRFGSDRGSDGRRDGGGFGQRSGGYGQRGGAPAPRAGGFQPRGDSEAPRGPRREAPAMERGPRQPGVVKFFKADKGFGFIMPDSGEPDVFVHISAVERSGLTTLESGQRVSFETEPDRHGKGPKAVELQIEEGGDQPA